MTRIQKIVSFVAGSLAVATATLVASNPHVMALAGGPNPTGTGYPSIVNGVLQPAALTGSPGQAAGWCDAGGGAVTNCAVSVGSTDAGVDTGITAQELTPIDLGFHEIAHGAMPGFMPASLVTLDDEFTNTTLTRFTIFPETGSSTPPTPSISGGQFNLVNSTGQSSFFGEGVALTVPQFAVKVNIASISSTSGNNYENPGVGYYRDGSNYIIVAWERKGHSTGDPTPRAGIRVTSATVGNWRNEVSVSWTPPFDLGMSLVSNTVVLWQRPSGGNWTVITSYAVTEFDMRSETLSNTWKPAMALATDSAHTVTMAFQSFQIGSFGMTGIRDVTPVTNEDGTVAFTGNQFDFAATVSDPTGAAYEAVFSYDIVAQTITQIGVIFVNRSSKLFNDNAAHIVLDGAGGFHFFITTWGNAGGPASGINILYKHETSLNLLSGISPVASMTQPTLPNITSGGGTYDPYAITQDGGLWYLAYTIGPSADLSEFPSLATTSDLATYTDAGQDPTAVPYEGTRIVKLAGAYWVLTSSLLSDVNAYDLTMTLQGKVKLTIPNVSGGTHYPPHPTIFPHGEYTYLTSFDNTVTNGVQGTQGAFRTFRARRYGLNLQ